MSPASSSSSSEPSTSALVAPASPSTSPTRSGRGSASPVEAAFVLDGVEVRTEATVVRALNDGFAVRFRSLSQSDESRVVAWIFRQEALALSRRIPA
jgi:hypothetical protein